VFDLVLGEVQECPDEPKDLGKGVLQQTVRADATPDLCSLARVVGGTEVD
jgi:hypothetical protein